MKNAPFVNNYFLNIQKTLYQISLKKATKKAQKVGLMLIIYGLNLR